MQFKTISLFIASYLIISTFAAPSAPAPAAQQANQVGKAGVLPEPVNGVVQTAGGVVGGIPVVGPTVGGLLGGVTGSPAKAAPASL